MSSWCYFCLKQLCSDWKRCLTNGLGDSPDADNETFNCSNWRLLPWKIRYIHLHLSESLVGVISRQGNQERIKGLSQEAFVQTLAGFSRRSCHVYGDRMGKKEWGHIFPFFFFSPFFRLWRKSCSSSKGKITLNTGCENLRNRRMISHDKNNTRSRAFNSVTSKCLAPSAWFWKALSNLTDFFGLCLSI